MKNALSRIAAHALLAGPTLVLPAACLAIPAVVHARNAEDVHVRGSLVEERIAISAGTPVVTLASATVNDLVADRADRGYEWHAGI